jgi:hypothetical protein
LQEPSGSSAPARMIETMQTMPASVRRNFFIIVPFGIGTRKVGQELPDGLVGLIHIPDLHRAVSFYTALYWGWT